MPAMDSRHWLEHLLRPITEASTCGLSFLIALWPQGSHPWVVVQDSTVDMPSNMVTISDVFYDLAMRVKQHHFHCTSLVMSPLRFKARDIQPFS